MLHSKYLGYGFLKNKKNFPVIAGLSAGLYPLIYNYDSNYELVKSPEQLLAYSLLFLALPVLTIILSLLIVKKTRLLSPFKNYLIPVINPVFFSGLLVLSAFNPGKKLLLLAIFTAGVAGLLLRKYIKRIVLVEMLMVIVALFSFVPYLFREWQYAEEWQALPDDIETIRFKSTPNIYFIQPDGYANPSELARPPYDFDNSEFEAYLNEKGFTTYHHFRSNYSNTVTSNSATFTMRHHYYNQPYEDGKTPNRYRQIIAGKNPVIDILKKNGYRTHLLLDHSYLVINRPEMHYDYCNIDYADIPVLSRGFSKTNDLLTPLSGLIDSNGVSGNFYFVEKIRPGHIPVRKADSKGREAEREAYLEKLGWANDWLRDTIELIERKDPDALVVIMADHGGFVGWDYTAQRRKKTNNKALIRSIFSSLLSVKWPSNAPPEFHIELRSGVNLFRILFAHLGQEPAYIENLEPDTSYMIVDEDAPFGVYQVIDQNGKATFEAVHP